MSSKRLTSQQKPSPASAGRKNVNGRPCARHARIGHAFTHMSSMGKSPTPPTAAAPPLPPPPAFFSFLGAAAIERTATCVVGLRAPPLTLTHAARRRNITAARASPSENGSSSVAPMQHVRERVTFAARVAPLCSMRGTAR